MNRIARIFAVALILAVGLTVNASAQTNYTLTTKVFDKYLGANGSVFYDAPVIQPDLFVAFQNGVYADLWASRGDAGQWGEDFDSEINVSGGWANEFFDGGILYIATEPSASDVLEFYLGITTRELGGWAKVYLKAEHYLAMTGNNPARGTITRFGLQGSQERGRLGFDWKVGGFYDTGAFGFSEGTLAECGVATFYNFEKVAWLSLGSTLKATTPIHLNHDDGREFNYAVGLVSKVTF